MLQQYFVCSGISHDVVINSIMYKMINVYTNYAWKREASHPVINLYDFETGSVKSATFKKCPEKIVHQAISFLGILFREIFCSAYIGKCVVIRIVFLSQ